MSLFPVVRSRGVPETVKKRRTSGIDRRRRCGRDSDRGTIGSHNTIDLGQLSPVVRRPSTHLGL